jgi:heptosyltransferase-2/heptosyltransferase-3
MVLPKWVKRTPAPRVRCERPLVVRCGAFGDMVLITALLGELSRRFGCPVDVLTSGPWSGPLLRGQPGVGEIYSVRSRKTPYLLSPDQQRVVRRLRLRGVGPTWFCDGNEAARPMLTRAGIPGRCIVDVQDHPLLPGEHATEQWRRLAQLDPACATPRPMAPAVAATGGGCHLEVSPAERAALAAWLETRGMAGMPLIAMQIGNKRTMRRGFKRLAVNTKYWPHERWAVVLRHLRERHPGHAIVLLGTGPEFKLNGELAQRAGVEGVFNVADDLPVPRLLALLARADGLITVDSGPAHAAAAVGCPLVVLFGRASTTLYRPWGTSGADVKVLTGQVGGQPDMLGITSAQVVAAWDTLQFKPARAACPV